MTGKERRDDGSEICTAAGPPHHRARLFSPSPPTKFLLYLEHIGGADLPDAKDNKGLQLVLDSGCSSFPADLLVSIGRRT